MQFDEMGYKLLGMVRRGKRGLGLHCLSDLAPAPGSPLEDAKTLLLSSFGGPSPPSGRVWLTTPGCTRSWDSSPTSQGSLGVVGEAALPAWWKNKFTSKLPVGWRKEMSLLSLFSAPPCTPGMWPWVPGASPPARSPPRTRAHGPGHSARCLGCPWTPVWPSASQNGCSWSRTTDRCPVRQGPHIRQCPI